MSQSIQVNGQTINYPETGDTNWSDDATNFAIQTSAALGKIGLSAGTSVDIPQTLDVTGNTTLDANLSVGGNTTLTGNLTVMGALDVTGNVAITGNTTVDGIIYADDNTTANTPVISFTGDTNTGIGRSAADTLDFITGGVSRSRLNSIGQQSSIIPDLSGSNTTLYNEYKCRAWVNFNGTTASPSTIRGSGNVSSVTKNGTGDYTINFTNALPDANYCISGFADRGAGVGGSFTIFMGTNNSTYSNTFTTTSARITTRRGQDDMILDSLIVCLAVFR